MLQISKAACSDLSSAGSEGCRAAAPEGDLCSRHRHSQRPERQSALPGGQGQTSASGTRDRRALPPQRPGFATKILPELSISSPSCQVRKFETRRGSWGAGKRVGGVGARAHRSQLAASLGGAPGHAAPCSPPWGPSGPVLPGAFARAASTPTGSSHGASSAHDPHQHPCLPRPTEMNLDPVHDRWDSSRAVVPLQTLGSLS